MGVRGGTEPFRRVEISTLIGDVLHDAGTDVSGFSDLERFAVRVLHPGRTLLEKLYAIHAEAIRLQADPMKAATPRIGRHLYDVFRLLTNDEVAAFFTDDTTVEAVLEEIEQVSREHFATTTGERRPEGGFTHSPAFDLSSDVADRLRVAYESDMEDLYYGEAPPPAWEQICGQVTSSPV